MVPAYRTNLKVRARNKMRDEKTIETTVRCDCGNGRKETTSEWMATSFAKKINEV